MDEIRIWISVVMCLVKKKKEIGIGFHKSSFTCKNTNSFQNVKELNQSDGNLQHIHDDTHISTAIGSCDWDALGRLGWSDVGRFRSHSSWEWAGWRRVRSSRRCAHCIRVRVMQAVVGLVRVRAVRVEVGHAPAESERENVGSFGRKCVGWRQPCLAQSCICRRRAHSKRKCMIHRWACSGQCESRGMSASGSSGAWYVPFKFLTKHNKNGIEIPTRDDNKTRNRWGNSKPETLGTGMGAAKQVWGRVWVENKKQSVGMGRV